MGLINISTIQPGMKLASPVFSSQGVLLLGEGINITSKHILIFKTWGVLEADIEGVETENNIEAHIEGSNSEELIFRQKSLAHRFSTVLENEIMAEIYRIAKKQLADGFFSL